MANQFFSNCVEARYTEQRITHYRGNQLIEALPPAMTDEELFESLLCTPEFSPEQRDWPIHERLQLLGGLSNFMVPLSRHIDLARALDVLIRNGYVGRVPRTAGHTAIFQAIYERQKAGTSFRQTATTRTPQLSTSLIGISGMGKTTTVTRWLAHIPQVIYHPELGVYQVPYLHVEMPSDGSSIKGLAHGILRKIDELIPGANYYEEYAIKGRPGADTLMRSVARVMHMHCVGILITDEVQNLGNSRKGGDTVMTELVSACNELQVPILFIGTNKAAKVLSKDFRQARRSSGLGIAPWDRFPEHVEAGLPNEWREFVEILWGFQWTKHPAPLDELFMSLLYRFSQGVIDVAIKLFVSMQARALADGTERITHELLADVYERELRLLHPMIEALQKNDLEALTNFDDIAPLVLEDILGGIERQLRSKASPLHKLKPSDPTFGTRIATSLAAIGVPEADALAVAESTVQDGNSANIADAMKKALSAASSVPRRSSRSKNVNMESAKVIDFSARPSDYRRAVQEARVSGHTTLERLKALGMAPDLTELLALS
jgi:hypothetical protein